MTIGDFQVSRNTAGYGKSLSLSLSGIFSPIIVVENMQHFVKKKNKPRNMQLPSTARFSGK